ncbi:unnamed protein product [Caenorhabditis brenneri]
MSFLRVLFFFALLVFICEADLMSCAKMDSASKVARTACIASCSVQNCGTGYCEKRGGRPTCICSRCDQGGNFPLADIISGIAGAIKG